MEESLKNEARQKMDALENGSYKPRVSTEQMLSFLEDMGSKGVDVKELVNSQDLRRLAYGKMTSKLYGFQEARDNKVYDEQGKFFLTTGAEKTELKVITVYKKEQDRSQYKGYSFTPEEKDNLFKNGQAGAVIELDVNHGKEGMEPKKEKCYVTYDRDLNRFKAVPAEKVSENTFKKFYGHELSDDQASQLKAGKPVMVDLPDAKGNIRKTVLQFDTFEFGLKQYPAVFFAPRKFMGVELTDEQRKALGEGKTIQLNDLTKKDGTKFNARVRLNGEAKMSFEPGEKKAVKNAVAAVEKPKEDKPKLDKPKKKKAAGQKI